ncbi:MAG: hypothetical protein ABIT38_14055 [Gemmatimonadaceae bacterium]
MSGVRNKTFVGVISYVASAVVKATTTAQHASLEVCAKGGYTGAATHCDAATVQHPSDAGDVLYAVVLLNAESDTVAIESARVLDLALVTSRKPPPPP